MLVALQLVEAAVVRPRVDPRTVRLGPTIALVVALLGFELYGVGGAVYGVALAVIGLAALDAVGRLRDQALSGIDGQRPEQRLQEELLVGVALERLDALVDPGDRVDERLGSVPAAADEPVPVGAGEHAEATAQLVGEVPSQLPAVALLEQLAPAAPLAEAGDPGVELGDLGGVAFGERGGGASMCSSSSSVARMTAAPVPSSRRGQLGERAPALGERRVGGEQAGPVEVAGRGRGRLAGSRRVDALGDQLLDEHVARGWRRSRCARSARRW